jgi:hypothetical protein
MLADVRLFFYADFILLYTMQDIWMLFIGGRGGTRLRAFATTIAYVRTQPTRTSDQNPVNYSFLDSKRVNVCYLFTF